MVYILDKFDIRKKNSLFRISSDNGIYKVALRPSAVFQTEGSINYDEVDNEIVNEKGSYYLTVNNDKKFLYKSRGNYISLKDGIEHRLKTRIAFGKGSVKCDLFECFWKYSYSEPSCYIRFSEIQNSYFASLLLSNIYLDHFDNSRGAL